LGKSALLHFKLNSKRIELVTSLAGIPEHFMLVADGSQPLCHVVWRKEKRIGVAFG